jgi:hypothetical protein
MARRPLWVRRHPVLVGVVAVVVVVFLTLTAVLFVFPATNAPGRVDAVVVLGGSGDRLGKGLALVREGYAPVLLVSDHQEAPCLPDTRRYRVICFNPDPATTQGEAEEVGRIASERHWRSLLVVPSIPQTTRARVRIDRCFHGTVLFDPVSPGGIGEWIFSLAYEWGALVKAFTLQRAC